MIPDNKIIPLPIPVPPMLERALGYPGPLSCPGVPSARYVAFYWTEAGDEAAFDDGQCSAVGMLNNDAYQAFLEHPAIAPHLQRFNLGSSSQPADFWLILDRQQQQFSVAPVAMAQRLVEEQWGPPPTPLNGQLVVEPEELQRAQEAMQVNASWEETTTTGNTQAIIQAMQAERQQCDELVAWLDAYGR